MSGRRKGAVFQLPREGVRQASAVTPERSAGWLLDAERESLVKLGRNSATPGGVTAASDPAGHFAPARFSQSILPVRPKREGGPILIRVWRREGSAFLRVYAGEGPAHSEYLDAWLHPEAGLVPRNAKLRISGAEDGSAPWLTEAETEKALRELAEQRRMTEQRRREAAERWHQSAERDLASARARMAEIEAELTRRG